MIDANHLLAYSAILSWVMIMTAASLGGKLWTPKGLVYGVGNRDTPPNHDGVAGRADRAAKNMLENMILFTALLVAARLTGSTHRFVELGANVFFFARVVYFGVYLAGIPVLRTGVWTVSVVGLALIAIGV